MQLRVLGVSGGIGEGRTTSFLINQHLLMDCGTGVADLSLAQMAMIDDVILTHSHMDHIACLPLLLDTAFPLRDKPMVVHATAATIAALRKHIFNWVIWPDFAEIPNAQEPRLVYHEIKEGETFSIQGCDITPIPAYHTVPAVGYQLNSGHSSVVFSGDTTDHKELWSTLAAISNLKHLIIELSFEDAEAWLATISKHYHTDLLASAITQLPSGVRVYITHLKPSRRQELVEECYQAMSALAPMILSSGDIIEF